MVKALVAALCAAALASPVAAESEASSERSKSDKKMRCESSADLGSRLSRKRVCMTEAEWREMRARTRTDLEKFLAQKPLDGN